MKRPKPKRDYHTVASLAQYWGWSESDVIHEIHTGKLHVSTGLIAGIKPEFFRISAEEVERYEKATSENDAEEVMTVHQAEPFSLESCVERLRAKGIPDQLGAYLIRENTKWKNHEIAKVYGRDDGLNERQRDARQQRGQRFCFKGKQLAESAEWRNKISEIVTVIHQA